MEDQIRRHIEDRLLTASLEHRGGPELQGRLRFLQNMKPLLHHGMTVSQARTSIRVAVGECIMDRMDWAYVSGAATESKALDAWIGLLNHRGPELIALGMGTLLA
jgi:hypothetical protein